MPSALIVGNDSEIGALVANFLRAEKWEVHTTSRRLESVENAQNSGIFFCDMSDRKSISEAVTTFVKSCPDWNLIVLSIGKLNPIGRFTEIEFDEW